MPPLDPGLAWTIAGAFLSAAGVAVGLWALFRGRGRGPSVSAAKSTSGGPMMPTGSAGQQAVIDRCNVGTQVIVAPGGQATVDASAGFLAKAYEQHQEDLLGLVKTLHEAAESPDRHGLLRLADERTMMLLDDLRSHIPESPLWAACGAWERASRDLADLKEGVWRRATETVRLARRNRPGLLNPEGFVESLIFAAETTVKGETLRHMEYHVEREAEGYRFCWGGYGLTGPKREIQDFEWVEEVHRQLLRDVCASQSGRDLNAALVRWKEARDMIRRQTGLLLFHHFVQGDCKLYSPKDR